MLLERIPIRIKLTFGHAIWMAIIFLAIGLGVYRVVDDNIRQSIDVTLMTSAKNIRDSQLLAKRRSPSPMRNWDRLFEDLFSEGRTSARSFAQLIDTSGVIQAKTRNIRVRLPVSELALSRAESGLETFENVNLSSGVTLRQLTMPVTNRGRFTGELIQIGTPMTATNQTLKSVKRMLWMTSSIGLGMSIIVGYLLTMWSLRPVSRITSVAASLGVNNDFDKRLKASPANDELNELMNAFNGMIDRIEDAFVRLRRFSGDVSHELRTPLAVLRGEAELALRRERSPEEYQEALRTIVKEAGQMSTIVEDLLLLARAQGNALQLQNRKILTDVFLDGIRESVIKKFDEKQIRLIIKNEAKAEITVSQNYFSLALQNLLFNACKHSAEGSIVELRVSATYNETIFEVVDYGEGIPEDSLRYIFDTFYRADTARNRGSGGVGIGLSLAKALVGMHGGKLSVSSVMGQGSTFTATLPHADNHFKTDDNHKKTAVQVVPSDRR
ncbi:MAG: HAMP domain-containing protein [Pseudobacteriovorax sp.]|nr:HAMP domain-containing protein [Pseudobacteriovorax sp.]